MTVSTTVTGPVIWRFIDYSRLCCRGDMYWNYWPLVGYQVCVITMEPKSATKGSSVCTCHYIVKSFLIGRSESNTPIPAFCHTCYYPTSPWGTNSGYTNRALGIHTSCVFDSGRPGQMAWVVPYPLSHWKPPENDDKVVVTTAVHTVG